MKLRWRPAVATLLGIGGLVWAGGTALVVPDAPEPADIILVLGGDGPPRAAKAAALFRAGLAPRVLVSGDGDCWSIRDAMVARGVPSDAVLLECMSRSTFENAALSGPILAQSQARSALLVTSWFHMRRALACLSRAAPGVRWSTVGAPPAPRGMLAPLAMLAGSKAVLGEMGKLAWYAWRYGVVPAADARSSIARSERP